MLIEPKSTVNTGNVQNDYDWGQSSVNASPLNLRTTYWGKAAIPAVAEQRQLTAVEKFSRQHEAHSEPQLAPHYRDLIPLTALLVSAACGSGDSPKGDEAAPAASQRAR